MHKYHIKYSNTMFLVITINHKNKQPFYPSNAFWLSDKKQELLTLREHLSSLLVFGGVRVLLIVLVFCVVFLFCLSSSCVLCTQCCQCL